MNEEIYDLLEDVNPDVDYRNVTDLIDGKYLDSLDVLQIVAAIDDEYDVKVPASQIVPANFNSAEGIWNMIERLQNE
jgi:D-alanine--poly(phosphoribitol) ligase subunit 2